VILIHDKHGISTAIGLSAQQTSAFVHFYYNVTYFIVAALDSFLRSAA
jgi:hypothetical protein